jgi:hypothetical protein
MSPATRAQSHTIGRGRLKIPAAARSSRTPTIRCQVRLPLSSRTPINRLTRPGAIVCGTPTPRLNHPRKRVRSLSGDGALGTGGGAAWSVGPDPFPPVALVVISGPPVESGSATRALERKPLG